MFKGKQVKVMNSRSQWISATIIDLQGDYAMIKVGNNSTIIEVHIGELKE